MGKSDVTFKDRIKGLIYENLLVAENINYGYDTYEKDSLRRMLIDLAIDDGNAKRTARKNMFGQDFQ